MNFARNALVALGALALASCATSDIEKPNTNAGETMHFKNLDKSGDGVLTPDELNPNLVLNFEFPRWDDNNDGVINEREFRNYVESLDDD